MSEPDKSKDISNSDGQKITKAAAAWFGTPYSKIGAASKPGEKGGGDCSGSTAKIYEAAGFKYEYQATATFEKYVKTSGKFRELASGEPSQNGDILLWSDHMAIFSRFETSDEAKYKTTERINKKNHKWIQTNDMWTASRPDGPAYRPFAIKYFEKPTAPKRFRWIGGTSAGG